METIVKSLIGNYGIFAHYTQVTFQFRQSQYEPIDVSQHHKPAREVTANPNHIQKTQKETIVNSITLKNQSKLLSVPNTISITKWRQFSSP